MKRRLFVNEEKRTIVVVRKNKRGIFKGRAKCSPEDTFDEELGAEIANLRMEIQYSKKKAFDSQKKANSLMNQADFSQFQAEKELAHTSELMQRLAEILAKTEEKAIC